MPHPSVLSGYEELLEVAEAILFSVALPPTVIDKYNIIQKQVKDRMSVNKHTHAEQQRDGSQRGEPTHILATWMCALLSHTQTRRRESRARSCCLEALAAR